MSSFLYKLILGVSILLMGLTAGVVAPRLQHSGNSDGQSYLFYARHTADHGFDGVRELVRWYAKSETHRSHPSPARLTYVFLAALLIKIFGESYQVLVGISAVSYLLLGAVCFYYARKLLSRELAACFLFLLSASPLTLGMACMPLSDSLLNLLWACSVWAFMDYVNARSASKMALVVVFVTLSLLAKESSAILLVFMGVFTVFGSYVKRPLAARDLIVLCGAPVAFVIVTYWIVLGPGDCSLLVDSLYQTHFVDKANAYAIKYSSGPWFRYFVDLLLLSPVITLMGLGYAGHLILRHSRDWKKMFFVIYFAVVFIPLSLLQHTKVVRFVINLEMVLALFCVWALTDLFAVDIRKGRWVGTAGVIALTAWMSFLSFNRLFIEARLVDPITFHLVHIQGFIPRDANIY